MLNQNELAAYCDRHDLTPLARQVIETVRSSPPMRRVRSGARNVAARFASRKMACVIQSESHKNELPAIVSWEYDGKTHEFYDQPSTIKVSYIGSHGKRVTHMMTPDFFVLQEGFAGWVECKTEEWLLEKTQNGSNLYVADGQGQWRCPPGEEYAAQYGLSFRVRSSAETNWVAVRNATFLADYFDERTPASQPEQIATISKLFERQALILLKELLDGDHGVTADGIYRMIVERVLYVDLAKDLLSEPERTYVFRDETAAKAYRLHLEAAQRPALSDLRQLSLEPGQSLVWDGKPWRIANAGAEDVFLQDEERVFTHVSRSALEQLVREGKVTGLTQLVQLPSANIFGALSGASPKDIEHTMDRLRALFPEKHGTPTRNYSPRALRKWRAFYRHAVATCGSGLVGLLPKLHCRGNRKRKLDKRVIEIMDAVITDLYADSRKPTLVSCWGEVITRCKNAGLAAPSEKAFRQQIRLRDAHEMQQAREGEKAAYDKEQFYWCLERTTPRHGERPFEIGHIDHTEIDLQFIGSRNGEPLGRAWLTILVDAFTRVVLAWAIFFEEPSYRSCMAVIRDCVRRHGRVPKTIVTDKGSEFESTYYEMLLAALECHKKTRPGGKPRFGSVVERMFGISNKEFIHNLAGNNQALQKPRRLSKSHDPRELAVWTLPSFRDAFEGYLDRVYGEAEHSALGLNPKQAMAIGLAQSGMRSHTLIPYGPQFVVMCMPTTSKGTAKVDPTRGVKIHYLHYWAPEFRDPRLAGQELPVRYDPNDASVAFVWLNGNWVLCRSELAAEFQDRSEKEIAIATQEIRARFKRSDERRAITASLIAAELRRTDATEKALVQNSRHQEAVAAEEHGLKKLLGIAEPQSKSLSDQSVWDDINLKYFGELA